MKASPTEQDVRKIAKEEFFLCFKDFSNQLKENGDDLKEIKSALLGDEYNPRGITSRVAVCEDYINKSIALGLQVDGPEVISWYKSLKEKKGSDGRSELQILQDGISGLQSIKNFKNWAAFLGITNIGTLAALIFEFFLGK